MIEDEHTIRMPGMLMIGAAGRDAGKTYFACNLLKRFAGDRDIVGVKVTPIERIEKSCPHGRDDCNVCANMKADFEIEQETDRSLNKDTCKLFAAGAKRVYWLRSLKSHLRDGVTALRETTGKDAICVCESNSLRTVVEPGLFIALRNRNCPKSKPSFASVQQHSDRMILFDGKSFDVDPGDFSLTSKRWAVKMDATAIVLAGGASKRMGQDKSMLMIDGKPMIQHICNSLRPWFREILISANDPSRYAFLNLPVIGDVLSGQGPLMGIMSAMDKASYDRCFVMACDIPHVNTSLILKMLRMSRSFDGVVPRVKGNRYEPLFAVYRKQMLATFDGLLASGERKIDRAYSSCRMGYADLARDEAIQNVNTMQDYMTLSRDDKDMAV